MVAAERATVWLLTRTERGREWIRRHRFLHPNVISIVRMPNGLICMLFWIRGWRSFSVLWFAFWMITDLTDGAIARRCGLGTPAGAWLDPLSDKLMYFPPLLYFGAKGVLDPWWAVTLVIIDIVGQASRLFVAKKAANLFGKAKTALITILLACTALHQIYAPPYVTPRLLDFMLVTCTILAFLSFYCKVIPDEWYANTLTFANFMCGIAAIGCVLVLRRFFDLFDGRLARRFGSTRHGAIFDDIADGTSFGLAIAVLVFMELGRDALSAIVAAIYFGCTVFRLIRFLRRPSDFPDGIFTGLPSPAGAMLAGASALLFSHAPYVGHALVMLSAVLMVSRIPYRHFGKKIWPELPYYMKLVGGVCFLIFVNVSIAHRRTDAFAVVMFGLALMYVVGGLAYGGRRREARTQNATASGASSAADGKVAESTETA